MKKYDEISLDMSSKDLTFKPIGGRQLTQDTNPFTQFLRDNLQKGLDIPEELLHTQEQYMHPILRPEFNNLQIGKYFHLDASTLYRVQEFSLFVIPWNLFYIIKSSYFNVYEKVEYEDYFERLGGISNTLIIPITQDVYNELHR